MRVLLIVTYACGKEERNGTQRRIKVSFGRAMMQALKLLQLVKWHIPWDEAMLSCEEIKPVAVTIIKLCLSVSKSISQ